MHRVVSAARFEESRIESLLQHPMLREALAERGDLVDALRRWRFEGEIMAPPEGTPSGPDLPMDPTELRSMYAVFGPPLKRHTSSYNATS